MSLDIFMLMITCTSENLANYLFHLQPMRACILGPPASGKSTVVRQLCEHFKLHHIKIQDVIKEAIDELVINSLHFPIKLLQSYDAASL